ncbi:AAA family ATPase [Myxococcus landrumensis]|uniref:TIR domain-containing protein n=1 Tax=Myxococcus landrumensis TaxID=2813577 RepID=A0ABX7NH29_9BACT|nr:AAA family ATPase [Myxococcus landrumus]QSQ17928.1 hypothetical protein JY572_18665 [Myxococcus landrumus]
MGSLVAARHLVEQVASQAPLSVELACLASFAVRVDPPLLRQLRLELLPESSPAVEADLWLGSLVTFRGPDGFVFAPGVGAVLRERLATGNPERYEQAWNITQHAHKSWLSPALRLEENLNYAQSSPDPEVFARARRLLRQAVAELARNPSVVAPWAAGATTRLSSDLMDMEEGRMLAMAARAHLPGSLLPPSPPSGPLPAWMHRLSLERMERIKLGVRMSPHTIEIVERTKPHDEVIELPRTNPLVVEVATNNKHSARPRPRHVFIDGFDSDRRNWGWCYRIRESLRQNAHQTFMRNEPEYRRDPAGDSIDEIIEKCDAWVIVISLDSDRARNAMWEQMRRLRNRSAPKRERFTLVLVHVLPENAAAPETPNWPSFMQWEQVQIEARTGREHHVIRRIIEVIEAPRKDATRWRRFDFAQSGPMRIPLTSGALRLRTLLGDEYVIEPAMALGLKPVPRPVDNFVVHPRALDTLLQKVSSQSSLITISGRAGTGKTQLVRRFLDAAAPAFPHGRYVLAPLQSGARPTVYSIAWEVVRTLAPESERPSEDVLQRYHSLTSEREIALVLEDVDQWEGSPRQLVRKLNALRPYRRGTLLVITSRAPIEGLNAPRVELEELDAKVAMDLLLKVAPEAKAHATELLEILGRLPTALHEVGVAISQLPSDFDLARYVELLRLASILTVFPSTFDRHAAATVLTEGIASPSIPSSKEAASLAGELIQAGLMKPVEHGRYALWRPIRHAAEYRSGELLSHEATFRYSAYYLGMAVALHDQYSRKGRARSEAIATFDTESANIVRAVEWFFPPMPVASPARTTLDMTASLRAVAPTLLRLRRPPAEREQWFQTAGHQSPEDPLLLLEVAIAQAELGRTEEAVETCERARALVSHPSDAADILVKLARFQLDLGSRSEAQSTLLLILDEGKDSSAIRAEFRYVTSRLLFLAGRNVEAEPLLREAHALATEAGDIRLEIDARLGLALIAVERTELNRAAALCEEALEFARSWRDDRGVALAAWELGKVRLRQRIRERARELLQTLVDYYRTIGHARAEQAARERKELLRPSGPLEASPPSAEPKAIAEIFQKHIELIVHHLRFDLQCSHETALDSAVDAIFSYLRSPERYDPKGTRIETYLVQTARRKALDRIRSESARTRREQDFADLIGLEATSPNENLEVTVEARRVSDVLTTHSALSNPNDLATLRLLLQGENSTETLAKAMGLDGLSKEKMRLEVKRQRDRIMKHLQRLGEMGSDDS